MQIEEKKQTSKLSPPIKRKLLSGLDQIKNDIPVTEKSSEEDLEAEEKELKEKGSSKSEKENNNF